MRFDRHDEIYRLRQCQTHFVFLVFFFVHALKPGFGGGGELNENYRKKPTLAQTIDQVMTIKTHTESSKTELSSGGKRPFKVWRFRRL